VKVTIGSSLLDFVGVPSIASLLMVAESTLVGSLLNLAGSTMVSFFSRKATLPSSLELFSWALKSQS
jgi:hypothetical protein